MKLEKIIEIVKENLAWDGEVTLESSLIEDLGADSLDVVELCLAFEDEFGVHIDDEDLPGIRTIGDVLNYIEAGKAS